jgi:PAS domain S-box-containing protein
MNNEIIENLQNALNYLIDNKTHKAQEIIRENSNLQIFQSLEIIAERIEKSKEQKLESVEKYKLIADNSKDVIWTLDLNGKFTYVSPSVFNLRGYTAEEVMLQPTEAALTKKSQRHFFDGMSMIKDAVMRDGKFGEHILELEQPCKDGTTVWTEATINGIYDRDGKVVGILGVSRDITERKEIENQLKVSFDRYNDLAVQSKTVSWEVNKDGLYTFISSNVKDVWGYSPEEIVNKVHFYDLHPVEFREEYKKEGLKLINSNQSIENHENPIITKNGNVIRVLTFGLPFTDENGNIMGFRGSDMDITERKRNEEKLHFQSSFQTLVSDISRNFFNVNIFNFDNKINSLLSQIGDFLDVDRTFIFEVSDDAKFMSNTYEWCNEGISSIKNDFHNFPINQVPLIEKVLKEKDVYFIPDVNQMNDGIEKQVLSSQKIKSLLYIPIIRNDSLIGFFGFDSIRNEQQMLIDYIDLINIISNIIADTFIRIQNETKIQKAQNELRENERTLQTILSTANTGISIIDSSGKYVMFNNYWLNYLGYTEKEIFKLSNLDITHPDFIEESSNKFQNVLEGKIDNYRLEKKYIRKDGKEVWGDLSVSVLRDDNQNVNLLVGIVNDITKQKLQEVELKESEEKSKLLSDVTFEGILIHSKGIAIDVNRALCNITGYSIDEILGADIIKLSVHNDFKSIVMNNLQHNYSKPYEIKIIQKNGTEKYVELEAYTMTRNNQIIRIVAVRDIDERKKMQAAIKESEIQFEKVLYNLPISLTIITFDGVLLYVNQKCTEMFEFDADEYLNKQMVLKFWDKEEDRLEWLKELNNNGIVRAREVLLRTAYGKKIFALASGIIIKHKGQDAVLSAQFDITERKRAEEEIRSYSIELETMNQELRNSKQIIEKNLSEKNILIEKLTTTREELEKLNSEKDKFFSIIAHDLKSPFSGFLNLTKILVAEFNSMTLSEINSIMVDLNSSAQNLYKLLENLLDWSRMQGGNIPYNPVSSDIYYLVNSIIEMKSEMTKQKKIEITNRIMKDTFVYADVSMINTTLRNLLSNALKFSNKGGKIEIGMDENNHIDGFLTFYVEDNGIGMSESLQSKLFKIDEKVSRTGTDDEPSTGLGLLLCKEFIEKHNGKIWVESEENKGSKFYFSLPV